METQVEEAGALPATAKRYSLRELLALCDENSPAPPDVQAWDRMQNIGLEVIGQ